MVSIWLCISNLLSILVVVDKIAIVRLVLLGLLVGLRMHDGSPSLSGMSEMKGKKKVLAHFKFTKDGILL